MSEEDFVRFILGALMVAAIGGIIVWDAKIERRNRKMREERKDE